MAKKGGLLSAIKADVERTGSNRGKFFYVKSGSKARIRFLEDFEEGRRIPFHDRWDPQLKVPCRKYKDEDAECPWCSDPTVRQRDMYCWAMWDYEGSEVRYFMYPANNCSPVPTLAALFETYGTISDRDFTVARNGTGTNTSYTVIGLDKSRFRNENAEPLTEKDFVKALYFAHPEPSSEEDEEKKVAKTKPKEEETDTDDLPWEDDESEEDDELDYNDLSPKELYALCKDRGIKVEPKKPKSFYIGKLQKWDIENEDDESDDDDDGFWED